jgi:hypothetical protein
MMNGCGGKGSWVKAPNFIFEASCNKHDEGYNTGGDDAKRFECDGKFFIMMIKDSFRVDSMIKRLYYQSWALVYFTAVRIFGKKYFNYN